MVSSSRRPALLVGLAGLALAVSACAGDPAPQADAGAVVDRPDTSPTPEASPTPAPEPATYVALGDSYAAAPGVPTTDPAGGCYRSDANYPHLLATELGLGLTDVTCSAATTGDLLEGQDTGQSEVAPQLDALTEETELVTLGIGGNDADLFTTVLVTCAGAAQQDPTGSPCTDTAGAEAEGALAQIEESVGRVLDEVAVRAPQARVVVVGYPSLLPTTGSCPDLVPFAAGDYPYLDGVTRGLSEALRGAAEERDLDFVDVYAASAGHDICSDDPWVNGQETAPDGTIPFHPLPAGQAGVAALIARLR